MPQSLPGPSRKRPPVAMAPLQCSAAWTVCCALCALQNRFMLTSKPTPSGRTQRVCVLLIDVDLPPTHQGQTPPNIMRHSDVALTHDTIILRLRCLICLAHPQMRRFLTKSRSGSMGSLL